MVSWQSIRFLAFATVFPRPCRYEATSGRNSAMENSGGSLLHWPCAWPLPAGALLLIARALTGFLFWCKQKVRIWLAGKPCSHMASMCLWNFHVFKVTYFSQAEIGCDRAHCHPLSFHEPLWQLACLSSRLPPRLLAGRIGGTHTWVLLFREPSLTLSHLHPHLPRQPPPLKWMSSLQELSWRWTSLIVAIPCGGW